MKVCCVRGALRSKLWKIFIIFNTLSLIVFGFGLIHNNYYTKSKNNITNFEKVSSRNETRFGQSTLTPITNDVTYNKTPLTSLNLMIENKTDFVNASKKKKALPLCPDEPSNKAALKVNIQSVLDANDTGYHNTTKGGEYKPIDCKPRESVAIIVPYRDREEHKNIFLKYMHWFLQRQQVHYKIFMVELAWPAIFNRGLLLNVGFEKGIINYYKNEYVGGVLGLPGSAYRCINGFSNRYFGWGGEDDDIQNRMKHKNLTCVRLPVRKGSYYALPHDRDAGNKVNPERYDLLKKSEKNPNHYKKDGLNSLQYEIIKREAFNLYEWILVKVDESVMKKK